jgi:hypothetical protein
VGEVARGGGSGFPALPEFEPGPAVAGGRLRVRIGVGVGVGVGFRGSRGGLVRLDGAGYGVVIGAGELGLGEVAWGEISAVLKAEFAEAGQEAVAGVGLGRVIVVAARAVGMLLGAGGGLPASRARVRGQICVGVLVGIRIMLICIGLGRDGEGRSGGSAGHLGLVFEGERSGLGRIGRGGDAWDLGITGCRGVRDCVAGAGIGRREESGIACEGLRGGHAGGVVMGRGRGWGHRVAGEVVCGACEGEGYRGGSGGVRGRFGCGLRGSLVGDGHDVLWRRREGVWCEVRLGGFGWCIRSGEGEFRGRRGLGCACGLRFGVWREDGLVVGRDLERIHRLKGLRGDVWVDRCRGIGSGHGDGVIGGGGHFGLEGDGEDGGRGSAGDLPECGGALGVGEGDGILGTVPGCAGTGGGGVWVLRPSVSKAGIAWERTWLGEGWVVAGGDLSRGAAVEGRGIPGLRGGMEASGESGLRILPAGLGAA